MKLRRFPFLLLIIPVLISCSREAVSTATAAPDDSRPVVYTVNYPLYYFADRIAGEHIDLRFIAPPDVDPAYWKPSNDEAARMQQGDILFLNGATYAKWMTRITMPMSILYDTSKGFSDDLLEVEDAVIHSHGNGKAHSHAGTAFTTWLDFSLAKKQAEVVRDVLVRKVPGAKKEIESNAKALLSDLGQLDETAKKVAAGIGDRPLVASHPVYQYLADAYELKIRSVHWEPDTVPDAKAVRELSKILSDHEAGWMIWEGEPNADSIALLEERGIHSLVFDPCGNRPSEGDWLSVMRANLENLKSAAEPKE